MSICFLTFPGTEIRPTSLWFPASSFLLFLKIAVTFAFFSPQEPFRNLQSHSEGAEWHFCCCVAQHGLHRAQTSLQRAGRNWNFDALFYLLYVEWVGKESSVFRHLHRYFVLGIYLLYKEKAFVFPPGVPLSYLLPFMWRRWSCGPAERSRQLWPQEKPSLLPVSGHEHFAHHQSFLSPIALFILVK